MGKFSDSIDASLEWTATVLFRPFNLKKWAVLGFIAALAGSMASANFNIPSRYPGKIPRSSSPQCATDVQKTGALHPQTAQGFFTLVESKVIEHIRLILIIGIIMLLLFLAITWLVARFHFVFLESIVNNDASIKMPFRKHKKAGESLFNFLVLLNFFSMFLVAAITFLCLGKLRAMGAISHPESVGLKKILFACLPYAGWMIVWVLIGAVIQFVVYNFVTIVMYRDGCGFKEAWGKARILIKAHLKDAVKFFFLKAALVLCCAFGYGIIAAVSALFLMMPLIMVGGLLYALSNVMPQNLHLIFAVILVPLILIAGLLLGYGIMCMFLPFAVFLRTVSLKFMARLNSRYNLFIPFTT